MSYESTDVRRAVTTAYINPASSRQLLELAEYTLADGSPAIDFVCLFGANYASPTPPFLRAQNNQPPTQRPLNENLQQVIDDGTVAALQERGIKVLLTVLNGWQSVGWSEFTLESDAAAFAEYLKDEIVYKYGLDGIDIDDEYSKGTPNPTSLIMVTTQMRQLMPDKLITKALFNDEASFQSSWQKHTLAENLDYGWEMTYGPPPQSRLPQYTQWGMKASQLSLGFWSGSPSRVPAQDIAWLKGHGYGGFMIFAFEQPPNVPLMGQLVDDWYGPGNWNKR